MPVILTEPAKWMGALKAKNDDCDVIAGQLAFSSEKRGLTL
jgi:hypothetical protein